MKNEAHCRRKEGAQRKLPHPTFAAKLRKFFALKLDIKVASALKIVTCISFSLFHLSLGLSQFSFLKLHTQLASEKCRSLSWLSALFRLPMSMLAALLLLALFNKLAMRERVSHEFAASLKSLWNAQAKLRIWGSRAGAAGEKSSANSRERHINCQLLRIAGVKCGWLEGGWGDSAWWVPLPSGILFGRGFADEMLPCQSEDFVYLAWEVRTQYDLM